MPEIVFEIQISRHFRKQHPGQGRQRRRINMSQKKGRLMARLDERNVK